MAKARNSNALVHQPNTSATDHAEDYMLLKKTVLLAHKLHFLHLVSESGIRIPHL